MSSIKSVEKIDFGEIVGSQIEVSVIEAYISLAYGFNYLKR
jgi:hypothetical protein